MLSFMTPLLVIGPAVALSWPIGRYMRWALDPVAPDGVRRGFERLSGLLFGRAYTRAQRWPAYCFSMLTFNVVMFSAVYLILTLQHHLPLNPDGREGQEPSLAFNTAASFTTNTNLQHYSGESSLSHFSQVFGLMWLQFVSAATGVAALAALARGLAGREEMGNFYADVWRASVLVFLPLALVWACLLALCGVPMTFEGAVTATTLEGAEQVIARGPVAAFVTIKQLGSNGGGFFGPNSTHPLENVDFWSNILEDMAILQVPMACVWMFGHITGRVKHAAVLFGVMLVLLVGFVIFACVNEAGPARALEGLPVEPGMNMEGKELRFGPTAGPTWAVTTTCTSNGSVDAMHDSLNPLTGLTPMVGMWLNVVFGGCGVGVINMILYVVTAVFLSGMMVGRTPEYLTRKVEAKEMKLALIALLAHPLFILGGTAVFAATDWGAGTPNDPPGPHGFSEILYEFTSAAANNGSGFEGLGDNTVPWNVATGMVMLLARFIPIIAPLAIAGSLAAKRSAPESGGTFRTDTLTFGVVLLGIIVIVGALMFLPVAVLGPIAEHLESAGTAAAEIGA